MNPKIIRKVCSVLLASVLIFASSAFTNVFAAGNDNLNQRELNAEIVTNFYENINDDGDVVILISIDESYANLGENFKVSLRRYFGRDRLEHYTTIESENIIVEPASADDSELDIFLKLGHFYGELTAYDLVLVFEQGSFTTEDGSESPEIHKWLMKGSQALNLQLNPQLKTVEKYSYEISIHGNVQAYLAEGDKVVSDPVCRVKKWNSQITVEAKNAAYSDGVFTLEQGTEVFTVKLNDCVLATVTLEVKSKVDQYFSYLSFAGEKMLLVLPALILGIVALPFPGFGTYVSFVSFSGIILVFNTFFAALFGLY